MEGATNTEICQNSPLARLRSGQDLAIEKLMTTKSVVGAARAAGIAQSTLQQWLAEPGFRAAMVALQQSRFDEPNREALRLGKKAFGVLETVMDDPTAPGWLRARAATDVLNFILRFHEVATLEERLAALEAAVGETHDPYSQPTYPQPRS